MVYPLKINNVEIDPDRQVGEESRKTFRKKLLSGFFQKYMSGKGLDIGYAGYLCGTLPILPDAIGIDRTTPGYDGKTLPFSSNSLDYIYSSHTLEHIDDYIGTLREWYRVVKEDGYLIITVPHRDLYEKKMNKPSRYNGDHRRFYTPASFLREIEESFEPNSYRIRLLQDDDSGYDYNIPPEKHCAGTCEVLVVIQKIKKPTWEIK
jgi:SAM-dependent methyltransferase